MDTQAHDQGGAPLLTDLTKDEAEAQLKRKRKAAGEKAVVTKYRSSKKSIQIPSDLLAIYGRRGQPSQCDIGHLIVTRCT